MAKQFPSIQENHREFIFQQKMFFSASAASEGRVNVSPKGLDTFRYLGPNEVAYLDLTGSGNETAAHIKNSENSRLTLMFCAFEDPPMILRLYGKGNVFLKGTQKFEEMKNLFPELPGSRQIIHMDVELVQTSCGYGVPLFDFKGQRSTLIKWAETKGPKGLQAYQLEKNTLSIDGYPTGFKIHQT
jgi:hypothetical protein